MIPDVLTDISPYSWLLVIYAIGFALISSFFHYSNLLKKHTDDFKAFIRYFVSFFVLLFDSFFLLFPYFATFLLFSNLHIHLK